MSTPAPSAVRTTPSPPGRTTSPSRRVTSRKSPSPPLRKLASAADTSYRAIESEAPPDEAHRLLCAVQAFSSDFTGFGDADVRELERRLSVIYAPPGEEILRKGQEGTFLSLIHISEPTRPY